MRVAASSLSTDVVAAPADFPTGEWQLRAHRLRTRVANAAG